MRAFAIVLILLFTLPISGASALVPERWLASGEAQWRHGLVAEGAREVTCEGALRMSAHGPWLLGEHAGQYRVRIELDSAGEGCEGIERAGWIDDPHADTMQIVREDATSGTLLLFATDEDGVRTVTLADYVLSPEGDRELNLVSVIQESDGLLN